MRSGSVYRALLLAGLFGAFAVAVLAQAPPADNGRLLSLNTFGIKITDVDLSGSYFSESIPGLSTPDLPPIPASRSADEMLTGGLTLNWAKTGERGSFSLSYTPSYVRQFRLTDYHSFDQTLSAVGSRRIGTNLTLAVSFQGVMTDFNQLLFAPSLYGNLTSASATLDELASALLTGASANPGLGQLLSLAPVNGAANTAFYYGGRELSTSASASLLYTQSTRSSYHLSFQGMRTQYLSAGSGGSEDIGPAEVIPMTTTGSASLGWSYSLTPRTTFSLDGSASRAVSRYQDAYATQATGSLGRTLTDHWFAQIVFGAGYILPERETFHIAQKAQPEAGGTLAYKFKAQSLLGGYMRTVSDSYGLGAYATESSNGAWSWNRPGSSMGLTAGFGYSHLTGPGFPNTTSWTGHASVSKQFDRQLTMNLTYSYVQYPETLFFGNSTLALNGLMVGIDWSPWATRQ